MPVRPVEARSVWLDRGTIVSMRSAQQLAQLFDKLKASGINVVYFDSNNAGFALYPSQSVLAMRGLDDEKGHNEHGAAWFPKGAQFSTASGAWASSNVSSGGRPRSVVDVNNPADKRLNSIIGRQMNRIRGELLKLPDDVVRLEYILSIEGP